MCRARDTRGWRSRHGKNWPTRGARGSTCRRALWSLARYAPGRSARGRFRPCAGCSSLTVAEPSGPGPCWRVHSSEREAQEVELAFRDLADLCLVLVHCQLQLAHDFAQAMQRRFGVAPPAQDHEVIGISDKASAKALLKAELLPPQHKPAHVDVRQQW